MSNGPVNQILDSSSLTELLRATAENLMLNIIGINWLMTWQSVSDKIEVAVIWVPSFVERRLFFPLPNCLPYSSFIVHGSRYPFPRGYLVACAFECSYTTESGWLTVTSSINQYQFNIRFSVVCLTDPFSLSFSPQLSPLFSNHKTNHFLNYSTNFFSQASRC